MAARLAIAATAMVVAVSGLVATGFGRPDPMLSAPGRQRVHQLLAELPLAFEKNVGQAPFGVEFLARLDGHTLSLTEAGAVFGTPSGDVTMELEQPNRAALRGGHRLPGIVSYFRGADPADWHTSVPTFGAVEYAAVYPGIDLVFHGHRGELEYDFVLAPGADPRDIAFSFRGAGSMSLSSSGDLILQAPGGRLLHRAPVLFQRVAGERRAIDGGFRLEAGQVGFEVGDYDHRLPLVIDPQVLAFSTLVGGAGQDKGNAIAVDGSGNVYVTGLTTGPDFPTTGGSLDQSYNGGVSGDAFVFKLDPTGSTLLYSAFLGGGVGDEGTGIAVDGAGNAFVTGFTRISGTAFPTTGGAYDTSHNGDLDVFVTKLNPSGSALSYSTFIGGGSQDIGYGIAVDGSGSAYVTGTTTDTGTDFPTTAGALRTAHAGVDDAFLVKFNAAGSARSYSTLLGGSAYDIGYGIAVDGSGRASVVGETFNGATDLPTGAAGGEAYDESHNGNADAFVTRMNGAASALSYSTFLGGPAADRGRAIALDGSGNAHVTGAAGSGFPDQPGSFDTGHNGGADAFVTKLDSSGMILHYSTFLGGAEDDVGYGIAVDASERASVTGETLSEDFPTTSGALDVPGGGEDAFVTRLPTNGVTLESSVLLGGDTSDIAYGIDVDGAGDPSITGQTFDSAVDFPTTTGAHDQSPNGSGDVFVARLTNDDQAPDTTITKRPKKKTTKRKAKFRFESSEPGSTFECKLDKKPFAACSSPHKRRVKPGKHTFLVRAVDAAGNVDPTPEKDKFKRIDRPS